MLLFPKQLQSKQKTATFKIPNTFLKAATFQNISRFFKGTFTMNIFQKGTFATSVSHESAPVNVNEIDVC